MLTQLAKKMRVFGDGCLEDRYKGRAALQFKRECNEVADRFEREAQAAQ